VNRHTVTDRYGREVDLSVDQNWREADGPRFRITAIGDLGVSARFASGNTHVLPFSYFRNTIKIGAS